MPPVDEYAPNLAQLRGSPKSPVTIFGDRLREGRPRDDEEGERQMLLNV